MKTLSERAKLAVSYTNHCIRATVVTKLDQEGFEARHIMVVSSHKSENSLKSYASKCPDNKKQQMFDALARPFVQNPAPQPMHSIENVMPPQPSISNQNQQPNFKLVDLFPDMEDDPLNDDNFLAAIQNIEYENAQITSKAPPSNLQENQVVINNPVAVPPSNFNSQSITSNVIKNVHNTPVPMPNMYFPNSNVTINNYYNSN